MPKDLFKIYKKSALVVKKVPEFLSDTIEHGLAKNLNSLNRYANHSPLASQSIEVFVKPTHALNPLKSPSSKLINLSQS